MGGGFWALLRAAILEPLLVGNISHDEVFSDSSPVARQLVGDIGWLLKSSFVLDRLG